MTILKDSNVLVTGASRGLGAILARHLVDAGARVALVARSEAPLQALAAELGERGGLAVAVPADLSEPDALDGLLPRVEQALGPVDILVNNAGVEPFTAFEEGAADDIRTAMDVNVTAAMVLSRAVVPGMLDRGRGHLVFVSSTSGLFGVPYMATYAATKAALQVFSQSLRMELGERGVTSTAILPGFVEGTGMFEDQRGGRSLKPPRLAGSTTAEAVATATLDAIRRDRPEAIVNSMPGRPLGVLGAAAPRLTGRIIQGVVGSFLSTLSRG